MNSLDTSLGATLARQGLQLIAGVLVAKGVVDEATATAAIGGLLAIGTAAWAYAVKRRSNAAAARAPG